MQRVALELHEALQHMADLSYSAHVLRVPWAQTHLRTVPFLWSSFRAVRSRAAKREIDVVLFSSMVTASLAVPLRKILVRSGVAAAAIVHGQDVTMPVGVYQRFVPSVFRSLDLLLPVSTATGQAAIDRGMNPSRVSSLGNGVDVDRFPPPVHDRESRRAILGHLGDGLPPDTTVLCSVGRQVRRKGSAWFVEHVLPHLPPTYHYLLAGDGPENERIRETVQQAGVGDRVRMLGRVSEEDLERLYRGADLFIMPNISVPGDMEGFGVVMLEAGLCGMPTVGARLEGIAEVITDGENGQLVPSGDSKAFVDAVLALSRSSNELAHASRRAFRFTRDTFSWDSVALRYVEALRSLVSETEVA
jgi:phosphatidylinositol alpha-1,6-mannosyltransferase